MTQHQTSCDITTFSTQLDGRVLCGDGDSIVDMDFLYDHILNGGSTAGLFVSKEDALSPEVLGFNKKFKAEAIDFKREIRETSTGWDIPKKYRELDLQAYILGKLKAEINEFELTDEEIEKRHHRICGDH